MAESIRTNVLGGKLLPCCFSPMTGFYRDGYCLTGPGDYGLHTVCIEATAELRNILAQGYLGLNTSGGHLLLVDNPRSVRGGLAFIF